MTMLMLPPVSCRALAPSSRGLYHAHTTHSLGASSDVCASLCLVSSRRAIHQKANATYIRRHVQLRNPTSYSVVPSPTQTTTRHRSSWGRDWDCYWSSRHRPDCTWVRSTTDPSSTPADKNCPACQENQRRPFVLSPRELLWQKKVEHMRQWVEKDPYDVLFGKSNDRLNRAWQGWRLLQAKWPFIHAHATSSLEDLRGRRKCYENHEQSGTSTDGKVRRESALTSNPAPESGMHKSPTSSTTNHLQGGDTEWHFDPISMRRVPKSTMTKSDNHVISDRPVDIPVKTFVEKPATQSQPGIAEHSARVLEKEQPQSMMQTSQTKPETSRANTFLDAMQGRAKTNQPVSSTADPSPKDDFIGTISRYRFNTASMYDGLKENLESSYQAWRGLKPRDRESIDEKDVHEETSIQPRMQENVGQAVKDQPKSNISLPSSSTDPAPEVVRPIKANSHVKEVFEQSWNRVREAREKRSRDTALYTAIAKTEQLKEELGKISQLVQQQANFRHGAPVQVSDAGRKACGSIYTRNRPYKHMTSHEFGVHKAAILRSWSEKQKSKPVESAAQKMLEAEIEAQKIAMVAHENKWSKSKTSKGGESNESVKSETLPIKSSKVESAKDYEERMENRALVRDITSIYENTYGTIDTDHRQGRGALDGCLSDYESKMGGCYSFTTGQDNFEKVAKNSSGNPIFSALANMENTEVDHPSSVVSSSTASSASTASQNTGYEEYDQKYASNTYTFKSGQDDLEQELKTKSANPYAQTVAAASQGSKPSPAPATELTGYEEHDRKLGANPYVFVSGEDNLEQELKTKSANPYAEAVATAKETNTPLLTKLEQRYKMEAEVEAAKSKPEVPNVAEAFSPPSTTTGVIQPISPTAEISSDPQLYQILAYDTSDHAVHAASASSSFSPPTGETVLALSDALTRLHAPAKFLPLLAKHQADGYEIVSASRNLLVLKRMRLLDNTIDGASTVAQVDAQERVEDLPPPEPVETTGQPTTTSSAASAEASPVDGTTSYRSSYSLLPQTGNFASPTGFVNHDLFLPPTENEPDTMNNVEASKASTRKNGRVRKREPVFSGVHKRWDDNTTPPPSPKATASEAQEETSQNEGTSVIILEVAKGLGLLLIFCYIVGIVIEQMRPQSFSSGNGGDGNAGGQGSHGAGSLGHGLTDRAVWTTMPASQHASMKKNDGDKTETTTAASMQREREDTEEVAHAAQWIGAALCIYSVIGLAWQLVSGGE